MNEDRPTIELGRRRIEDATPGDDDLTAAVGRAPSDDGLDDDDDDDLDHGFGAGSDEGGELQLEPDAKSAVGPPPAVLPVSAPQPRPIRPTNQPRSTGEVQVSGGTRTGTTASPVEAMRLDEIARTQIFLKVAIAACAASAIASAVATGDPIAFRVVMAGCIVTAVGAAWVLNFTRDPANYTPRNLLPACLVVTFGAYAGVYYWGLPSPAVALMVYGLYFFSLGSNTSLTLAIYLVLASLHLVLSLLVMSGAIVDRGFIHVTGLSNQIAVLAAVEFIYLITFFTARISQRITIANVMRLEQAVRGVAQREAQLAEARADLDRALKVGGPGRYTEQVVGSFRLGVLIGRGGMGEVYEAFGVADSREAAVKLLHLGTLADPNHVARFLREAEIVEHLVCPNVVRVLEVGTTGGQIPFISMERLRGHDLAFHLRGQGRLPLEPLAVLVEQTAAGLAAARQAGIVHRDLKPHNLFAAEQADGTWVWKILDFGVSKAGGTGTLTKGHVVGTPAYMAPEQARGEDVDHRADVYSLAAIIYRCVTGHPAFTGKDVPSTLYDVVFRVPTQPSMIVPVVADLDRVLAVGLAKDPADRPATSDELAAWFVAAARGRLSLEQRARADALIERMPWGTRIGRSGGRRARARQ